MKNQIIQNFHNPRKIQVSNRWDTLTLSFFLIQGSIESAGSVSTMSDNIWSTLRMTLSLMGRSELHKAVDTRDLDHLNAVFPSESTDDGAVTV